MLRVTGTEEATSTARRHLAAAKTDVRGGFPTMTILPRVLLQRDILNSLLERAPETKRRIIRRLLDDYDVFLDHLEN